MAPRKDLDWLYALKDQDDWLLRCGAGLQQATQGLRDPDRQFPSTILLVGRRMRMEVQRATFSRSCIENSDALARIQLVASSQADNNPLFLADLDIHKAYHEALPDRDNDRQAYHRFEWVSGQDSSREFVIDKVVSRLLMLLTDVVCIFLDDFSKPEDAFSLVERWRQDWKSRNWSPRLLFITRQRVSQRMWSAFDKGQCALILLPNKRSSYIEFRKLRRTILRNVSKVQQKRSTVRQLFSATHLASLFDHAVRHVAQSIKSDFNFILATRTYNRMDDEFPEHLRRFLQLAMANGSSRYFILRYIASAILLDSAPPEMHRFLPQDVFDQLYRHQCHQAFLSECGEGLEWCNRLLTEYCALCQKMESSMDPSSLLHRKNLRTIETNWTLFRSSRTCLYCLRRRPEHGLACGHTFCDTCACIFGHQVSNRPYSYRITDCLLCQASDDVLISLKPPTAGCRLLVLDGGGIRGAFTLQALLALDRYRNLPYPIYDDFDLALGTSSGGLIVLMFLLRRSIEECVIIFKRLAQRVFSRRSWLTFPIAAKLHALCSTLLTDSLYGDIEIEACVKEAFGTNTITFGRANSGISRLKIAVTAMSVSDSRLCILSNYNGMGLRRKECGYKHFRPLRVEEEPLIREIARATSAAPSYFPAKFLRGVGYLQDGGAGKHNNPIDPAEWEAKAIWDSTTDMVVSIGTGYARDPVSPIVFSRELTLQDRFFPRLYRLFGAAMNAQGNWNDHLNRVHEEQRHKYFRINIALDEEPPLDDVSKIPELEKMASTFLNNYDFLSITQSLFATAFFFELRPKRTFQKGELVCQGNIRCRSPDSRSLLRRILEEYPTASFVTDVGVDLGAIGQHPCLECGCYYKPVEFSVCHPYQSFSIFLRFNRLNEHKISGFPQKIGHFVEKQLLGAVFGRPDHQASTGVSPKNCGCAPSQKRKRSKPSNWFPSRKVLRVD